MKVTTNPLILLISLLLRVSSLHAQEGVGIGTPDPHESAVLDVSSESGTRGMLIPRIPDRGNVVNPTTGLIIYHEASNTFEYYDGSGWVQLIPTPAKFDIDMVSTYRVINLANGSAPGDAVNKGQLDNGLNTVDDNNLDRDGTDTMTGDLNMGGRRVTNIANATSGSDAVNLNQWNQLQTRINDLENQQNNIGFLHKGSINIGDVGGDRTVNVTFPNLGTNQYSVYGSFISNGTPGFDNDLGPFFILSKTNTSFSFTIGERTSVVNNVLFEYIIFTN